MIVCVSTCRCCTLADVLISLLQLLIVALRACVELAVFCCCRLPRVDVSICTHAMHHDCSLRQWLFALLKPVYIRLFIACCAFQMVMKCSFTCAQIAYCCPHAGITPNFHSADIVLQIIAVDVGCVCRVHLGVGFCAVGLRGRSMVSSCTDIMVCTTCVQRQAFVGIGVRNYLC